MMVRIFNTSAAVLLLVFSGAATATGKGVGNVKGMRGRADLLRGGQAVDLREDDPVYRADVVKTFEGSRVKILFIDDSLVMIGEKTVFEVAGHLKKKGSLFRLMSGVMNVIVGRRGLEVHTPTAVTAARGTSFVLWVEKGVTGVAVTEGRVRFSNVEPGIGGERLIPAGRTSYVEVGKPPVVAVRTHPDLIKRYYEQTLEPEERWGPVILRATGSGAPPPGARSPAQARLMALRVAKLDALRELLEQAYGVTIAAGSTVRDFALGDDLVRSRVDAFIKGAWVAEERLLADGTVEVDMEIALGIGFRRMLLDLDE